jgi:hypothetical protein
LHEVRGEVGFVAEVLIERIRSTAAAEEAARDEAIERRRTASDWEVTKYRPSLIEDALSRYEEYSDTIVETGRLNAYGILAQFINSMKT